MPLLNLEKALELLAQHRPVFHSEADFQHALAWELQRMDSLARVRLEKQVASPGDRVHLDLLILGEGYEVAVEVKYKTRGAEILHGDETFSLRYQGAQDQGRYDFLKDIERLEKYVGSHPGAIGYAILLTNDDSYSLEPKKTDTVDSAFRVHEGRVLEGVLSWSDRASEGTKSNRTAVITLQGKYKIAWRDYSIVGTNQTKYKQFRYVALQVSSDG